VAHNGYEGVGLDESIHQRAQGNGDYPDGHRDSNDVDMDAGKLTDPYEDLRGYERAMVEFSLMPGLGFRASTMTYSNRGQDEDWGDRQIIDLISPDQTQDTSQKSLDEDEDGPEK
jgi:hypothetical protein